MSEGLGLGFRVSSRAVAGTPAKMTLVRGGGKFNFVSSDPKP